MKRLFLIVLLSLASLAAAQETPALLISPEQPRPGAPLRALVANPSELHDLHFAMTGPAGALKPAVNRKGGGPPFWQSAEFHPAASGEYRLTISAGGRVLTSRTLKITAGTPAAAKSSPGVWDNRRAWGQESELLYAAWIEALFQEAVEGASWPSLHEVTRRTGANLLHNHLGLDEDDANAKPAVIMEPDCADNPYYLRAYFSWKLGLPFGFHETGRGTLKRPPHTARWTTNMSPRSTPHPVRAFNSFLREVMNTIHSGAARTRLEDDSSDYYPLALNRTALKPGSVFADPYGHTFTLVRWVPQSGDQPGVLLAVDAQPDGTVAVKRFWKGNFLFNTSEVVGEPGFKAFRPIVVTADQPRLLTNAEIAAAPGYGLLSLEQKGMASAVFYDAMERLINPGGLEPAAALLDLFKALHEQLNIRVESVGNGESWMQAHPGTVITMPGSAAGVFLAGGLWEDYSTPNRDLRLLIAIDAVLDFPDRVVRTPGNYKMPRWKSAEKVREELRALAAKKAAELTITYKRADGSSHSLTIAEILQRREAFEMGYNPNDGVEIRWGAPEGSAEIKSCRRRAPAAQVEQMRRLRPWFQKRLHPPT